MPLSAPFLKRLTLLPERIDREAFPFSRLAWLEDDFQISLTAPITILAGENGSGKSTLLEAIAGLCGFSAYGGNQHHRLLHTGDANPLREALRAAWLPKVTHGFFFRAESFFNLANYIDEEGDKDYWGGKKLLDQSHGESFLATFESKFKSRKPSIYILDEPEAALSPQRMRRFLRMMDHWQNASHVQAIIATHSPIIMGMPGADLRLINAEGIAPCRLRDVPHFREMQDFFADPESYYDEAINTPLPEDEDGED